MQLLADGRRPEACHPTTMMQVFLGDVDMGRVLGRGLKDRNSAIRSRGPWSRCSVHALLRGIQEIGKRSLGAGNV